MKQIISIFLLTVFIPFFSYSQKKSTNLQDGKHDLVQFSGVVVEGDSLQPIPYTSIIVQNGYRGTVSDYFGYFSFVAQEGDTIEFSAIGFNSAFFIIPDTLTNNKYSLIQVLKVDTVRLAITDVYPVSYTHLTLPTNREV